MNHTRRDFLRGLGALVSLSWLVSLSSCSPRPSGPIKIGTLLDYTGALAEFGPPLRNSAELAAKHINDVGGLLGGRKLELVHEDAATAPSTAIDRAKKLIEIDKVPAIVGALASGVTVPVAQTVTIPNNIILISPASTSPLLTYLPDDEGKDLLFRTCPSDALQGTVLGKLAAELGYTAAAVIYVNNPYGQGLKDEFKKSFEKRGGRVVGEAAHPEETQPSYVAELRQLTQAQPDVLVAIGYPGHAVIYLKEALERGYTNKFLFVDGTKSEKIIEAVGAEALEGLYGTAPGSEKTRSLEIFNAEYQRVYNELPPQPFMTNTYDAVILLALAIERAGKAEGLAIRDALRFVANPPGEIISAGAEGLTRAIQALKEGQELDYDGAAGSVNLDEHGDVITPIEVWQYTNGTIQTVRLETPSE